MYLNKTNLFLVINICLIFFLLSYNDVKSEEVKIISGTAKVTDGDTIQIEGKKIRFFGIDAPEKKQQCKKPWLTISFISFSKNYPCGQISTDKLKKKINNKLLICKWSNKDRYKRYIAECFKDKTNVNAWMVKNGYAVAYKRYSKAYVRDEEYAKENKLGIWKGTFIAPEKWRKLN